MRNHDLAYRPLRGGVRIFNPAVNQPGTLGFVAAGDDGSRWIVSCHHVLCGPGGVGRIYQPIDERENLVAVTDAARARGDLDCAAARVVDGVTVVAEVLGIGPLAMPVPPEAGMPVVKSGAVTGVTEGTIVEVRPGRVEIEPVGLPEDYELSAEGDSGAVWVAKRTLAPVVLHQGGSAQPRSFAYGMAVLDVLAALNLSMLPVARLAAVT